ncbi:hypothetical protein F0562_019571 [Nyssa sinensis]|uniref:Uncharacterized protein n=1 Tax=Nyssa sinensis TaxID=561372 RepID=A0A5J5BNU1_9ASTE|nr:hypothetical protein F0562_019571 [Nyssa sinensis]
MWRPVFKTLEILENKQIPNRQNFQTAWHKEKGRTSAHRQEQCKSTSAHSSLTSRRWIQGFEIVQPDKQSDR